MNRTAVLLRNAPVLSGLSDDMLERVAADAKDLEVPAGEWIFREGEAAETMFIVGSGSVEVISERPQEALIGVLRRGEVLGELALLHQGTRSLSARARRGSRLLEGASTLSTRSRRRPLAGRLDESVLSSWPGQDSNLRATDYEGED
jgi:CRP-like cAMP-binding protein